METTHSEGVTTLPLLHPRLSGLDPLAPSAGGLHGGRGRRTRLGVLAGTLGTCLTITLAAHAVGPAAPPVAWTAATGRGTMGALIAAATG